MFYNPSFRDQLDANYICHHGIKGMHWGVRRYQNKDGSLTPRGQKRYNKNKRYIDENLAEQDQYLRKAKKTLDSYTKETQSMKNGVTKAQRERYQAAVEDMFKYHIDASKKISEIDPNAQSYRKTKKLVNRILSESMHNKSKAYDAYLNSPENRLYLEYLKDRDRHDQ